MKYFLFIIHVIICISVILFAYDNSVDQIKIPFGDDDSTLHYFKLSYDVYIGDVDYDRFGNIYIQDCLPRDWETIIKKFDKDGHYLGKFNLENSKIYFFKVKGDSLYLFHYNNDGTYLSIYNFKTQSLLKKIPVLSANAGGTFVALDNIVYYPLLNKTYIVFNTKTDSLYRTDTFPLYSRIWRDAKSSFYFDQLLGKSGNCFIFYKTDFQNDAYIYSLYDNDIGKFKPFEKIVVPFKEAGNLTSMLNASHNILYNNRWIYILGLENDSVLITKIDLLKVLNDKKSQ